MILSRTFFRDAIVKCEEWKRFWVRCEKDDRAVVVLRCSLRGEQSEAWSLNHTTSLRHESLACMPTRDPASDMCSRPGPLLREYCSHLQLFSFLFPSACPLIRRFRTNLQLSQYTAREFEVIRLVSLASGPCFLLLPLNQHFARPGCLQQFYRNGIVLTDTEESCWKCNRMPKITMFLSLRNLIRPIFTPSSRSNTAQY
jgi:hypothetical protein